MRVFAAFDWSFIWEYRADLWGGFKNTMKVAAVGIAASSAIGLILGAPEHIGSLSSRRSAGCTSR